jgi:hypothetical protein
VTEANHDLIEANYAPISDRWPIDTGAQIYVCNDRKLFITFEETELDLG